MDVIRTVTPLRNSSPHGRQCALQTVAVGRSQCRNGVSEIKALFIKSFRGGAQAVPFGLISQQSLCESRQCGNVAGRSESNGTTFGPQTLDRKSTRLNSSHGYISYAVFCLKKKKHKNPLNITIRYCSCCPTYS